MTAPYGIIINGHDFSWTVPPEAVQRTGGGRQVKERYAIDGTRLSSIGPKTGIRIKIASPADNIVMDTAEVAIIKALEADTAPFPVSLGYGYEVYGDFPNCWIEGEAKFVPIVQAPEYSTYEFTLYLI